MGRLKILIAVACAVFGLGGCTVKKSTSRLVVQIHAEPVSLDPALVEDGVGLQILGNVMEGLFGHDGQGHLQNRLAESYRVSSDGKRYEFTLLPQALWSDGMQVKASDFVTSFKRVLGPESRSKSTAMLSVIESVSEKNGKFLISLKRPIVYLPELLTLTACLPERADILNAHHERWPEDAPVTGPYRIASHKIENQIVLTLNEKYRALPEHPIREVQFLVVPDESTGVSLFEKGDLDILTRIPPLDLQRLAAKYQVVRSPYLATYYIAFNTRKPPFDQIKNRKAIARAISKSEIVNVLGAGEQVADSWVPPILGGLPARGDASEKIASDLKSRALTAGFDSSSRNSLIMEKIGSDIHLKTGARVSLVHQDWKSYIQLLQTDPPQLYRFAWLAPFMDPVAHLQVFTKGSLNNYTGWSSARYDQLVDRIAEIKADATRTSLIQAAERILLFDEVPLVPLYHYVQNQAVSKRISGYSADPFGVMHFTEMSISEPVK